MKRAWHSVIIQKWILMAESTICNVITTLTLDRQNPISELFVSEWTSLPELRTVPWGALKLSPLQERLGPQLSSAWMQICIFFKKRQKPSKHGNDGGENNLHRSAVLLWRDKIRRRGAGETKTSRGLWLFSSLWLAVNNELAFRWNYVRPSQTGWKMLDGLTTK